MRACKAGLARTQTIPYSNLDAAPRHEHGNLNSIGNACASPHRSVKWHRQGQQLCCCVHKPTRSRSRRDIWPRTLMNDEQRTNNKRFCFTACCSMRAPFVAQGDTSCTLHLTPSHSFEPPQLDGALVSASLSSLSYTPTTCALNHSTAVLCHQRANSKHMPAAAAAAAAQTFRPIPHHCSLCCQLVATDTQQLHDTGQKPQRGASRSQPEPSTNCTTKPYSLLNKTHPPCLPNQRCNTPHSQCKPCQGGNTARCQHVLPCMHAPQPSHACMHMTCD